MIPPRIREFFQILPKRIVKLWAFLASPGVEEFRMLKRVLQGTENVLAASPRNDR